MATRTIRDRHISLPDTSVDDADELDAVEDAWDDDLRDALVRDVTLTGLRLANTSIIDSVFSDVDLSSANWSAVRVTGCRFEQVDLASARFERVTFDQCWFHNCRLTGASLVDTVVTNVLFEDCRLDYTTWEKVRAKGAFAIVASTLAESSLSHCELNKAVLDNCKLTRTEIEDCELVGTDLRGSDLRGLVGVLSLYGAVLRPEQLADLAQILARDLHIDIQR